ncbi:MAG TPA: tetratricopeptide repeat protein, partial [Bryobacteraceae bacterium]|nr:tetratricopeptide repeat protein [Bryobacteraceae bacterium]
MSARKQGTSTNAPNLSASTEFRKPGSVPPALAKAVSLHLEGKRKEALTELNTAIEAGDETVEIYSAKGHIQFELEQYDDAIKTYQKLLGLTPKHPTAHFNVGICYEKLSRWQDATDSFQTSLEIDPGRMEAQLGLGICLLHQEKPEGAIEQFNRVLARQPDNETALFGKAVAQQLLWKFDEATAIYQKILARNPQSEECLVNLITIGMARKDEKMIR